ncbi:hypothetical protein DVK01_13060 [Haloarcula sp. Atlit-120R]|nr:hypothetical protein DVK01_13060 [Haloarcula sp. Atlit-120R]
MRLIKYASGTGVLFDAWFRRQTITNKIIAILDVLFTLGCYALGGNYRAKVILELAIIDEFDA